MKRRKRCAAVDAHEEVQRTRRHGLLAARRE